MPALTDKQKKERAKKLKERKDFIKEYAQQIINDREAEIERGETDNNGDPLDEITEDEAIEQATDYYKEFKKIRDKVEKKKKTGKKTTKKSSLGNDSKANEDRKKKGQQVSERAKELYYKSDGVTKRGKYTWPEAQAKAWEEYRKEHGEGKTSRKKSPCSGREPVDDECDEECPIKYKSKSGNEFCKSRPVRTSSIKPRRSPKSSSSIRGPKSNPLAMPGHLYLNAGKRVVFDASGKKVLESKNKPIEFKQVKSRRYLFDDNGNAVEVKVSSASKMTSKMTSKKTNKKSSSGDDDRAKKDRRNAQQREYRRRKKEEKEGRSRSRSKSADIDINEDEEIGNIRL
jgi:hypothetical protein